MWCFLFVVLCFSSFVKCEDDVSVTVNCKQIENSKRNYSRETDIYFYNHEYHDNEWVFIKCEKTISSSIISDSLEYIGSELYIQGQMQTKRHSYLYIKLTKKTANKHVDCLGFIQYQVPRITRIYFKRSNGVTGKSDCDDGFVRRFEEIYFTAKEHKINSYKTNSALFLENFPIIKGLSHDNMLAVFFQKYTTLVIAYEYNKISENFYLTCIADNSTWVHANVSKTAGKNENSALFTINKTMSDVTCKSGDYSTTIKFHFEEVKGTPKTIEQVSSPAPNTIESGEEATEDQTIQGGMKKAEETTNILHDGGSSLYLIIGGGVTISLLFVVVLFVCFIKIFRKKPVTPNPEVNRSYETLTERNKDMNTMPSQRQYPEVQYCVPEDRVTNNDYAVPHQPTVEEMYTRPIPKNARKNANDNFGYESVDNRIANKPVGNSTLNKVLPTKRNHINANPYATVRFNNDYSETASESPYAEVNFEEANVKPIPGYTNAFEGQRYVNSNSNKADYAEPAYCEPNKYSK